MGHSTDPDQHGQPPNPSSTSSSSKKLKPDLSGTPETLLGMLYTRSMDAKSARPILGDRHAADMVDSIDYDWAKFRLSSLRSVQFSLRGRFFDRWTAAFVDAATAASSLGHKEAREEQEAEAEVEKEEEDGVTVLHLAAGLDTRALRILNAFAEHIQELDQSKQEEEQEDHAENESATPTTPLIHWVDADLPEVMDLRRRIAFPRPRPSTRIRYEDRAIDVTEPNWLAKLGLSRTRRTIVVMEGLTMYLQPAQGRELIQQLTSYFVSPSSSSSSSPSLAPRDQRSRHQLCFDCLSPFALGLQRIDPILRQTGSKFTWGIDDLHVMESWDKETGQGRLRLVEVVYGADNPETRQVSWLFWLMCVVCSWVPALKQGIKYARYEW